MIVYIIHGQVKELTYMHSEGIQVSNFETKIHFYKLCAHMQS